MANHMRVSPDTTTTTKPNMKSEIKIADFNFDIDGDGKIDEFERKVQTAFQAADTDKSGTLTPIEMLGIMRHMSEGEKVKKRQGRTIFALAGLAGLLVLMLGAVSITGAVVGGEAIKESKVPNCDDPSVTDNRCSVGNIVHTGSIESFYPTIFALATGATNQLAYLKDLSTRRRPHRSPRRAFGRVIVPPSSAEHPLLARATMTPCAHLTVSLSVCCNGTQPCTST